MASVPTPLSAVIEFEPLRRSDFPLLISWLSDPVVHRWWHHDTSAEAVERDFGPSIDGADDSEMFLARTDRRRFGLIQRYAIDAFPEYLAELEPVCPIPPGALSIDYLIGEPDLRGRGLGAAMIAQFVAAGFAARPAAGAVIVPVSAANTASWKALAGAGFHLYATGELEPDNPIDNGDHVIYRYDRPAGP